MILHLDDLIQQLTLARNVYGNIEVECNGFEGAIPIEDVTVVNVGDKYVCRIEEIA